ncbi:hypothetical protein ACFOZ7_11530 [Natribaculum luteum]|uniref:Uncharacterized protein n=1 Tax=Natribaculum luteum TaxID=1586232 RepID=A0ABD5P0L0_9EURY|nr:hypothetical protein [Natribaculum luteum]
MDAVEAAAAIDHENSVAHDTDFQIGLDPKEVLLTNMVTYMDGVFTPELVEELGRDVVSRSDLDELKREVKDSLITEENLPFLERHKRHALRNDSSEHTLTETQMETIIRVNSRVRKMEEEDILAQHADVDYPGPAMCTVAAGCVAVVAAAVYNTVGAVHTAAAAVAVETYVGVT